MVWQKQGLVFAPNGQAGWMNSHAQVPTPIETDQSIRVYFSSRPQQNLSLTTFVDLDKNDPTKVLSVNDAPILEVGKPGTFDEHGIMPSCAVRNGQQVYLYYSGWSRGSSVPYTNSTGLAISDDGGKTFQKISDGPILGKGIHDPYSATSPCVLRQGDDWHMWYCSGTGWQEIAGKYEHTYDIKHAQSPDGITWSPDGKTSLRTETEYEALTRPFVTQGKHGYDMWFCYRGSLDFRDGEDAYRIGYAFSSDLLNWQRRDSEAGIAPAPSGWDSKMIAYPAVITVMNRTWMFYNGNGFGKDGFGIAEWLS
jgi:predicted GH43/DUF377 family glycosyl hydrolase